MPEYVKTQLQSLINRASVSSLLAHTTPEENDGAMLAGFALTLLLVFPAKKQDIKMWLCMTSTADAVPAVRYFWVAVEETRLFEAISNGLRVAIDSLKE